MRWIWIDRIVDLQPGRSARAVKNLSCAEEVFRDHLPGYPIMPASLILEGLAQTGGILVGHARDFREQVILAKIGQARFFREVQPGEQLTFEANLLDLRAEGATVCGRVFSAEEMVAEAELMFAHVDPERTKALTGTDNFVFAGELRRLLGLSRLEQRAAAPVSDSRIGESGGQVEPDAVAKANTASC